MKKCEHLYEIFLNSSSVSRESWHIYLENLKKFIGFFRFWKIIIMIDNNCIRYFLKSKVKLPVSLNTVEFLIKETTELVELKPKYRGRYFNDVSDNIVEVINKLEKKERKVKQFQFKFFNVSNINLSRGKILYEEEGIIKSKKLFFTFPEILFSIDFSCNKGFFYKKMPKYLNIDKTVHLFQSSKDNALFQVDTFPYLDDNFYLKHYNYDFDKHSLVIGASGSGKSKFLSLLISNISKYSRDKYKIVVIDPHDALKDDLSSIYSNRIIDFNSLESSIDLFKNNLLNVNAIVELTLSLFKNLINDSYNSRLERVLRFSTYILMTKNEFSFIHLKKLLLDLEYRNSLINELKMVLPPSVSYFFLTEFNELKTKAYNDAIAPIIAFIDEMQMVPVFNLEEKLNSLSDTIQANFLSIFSLNRLSLGDKVTKTIAGFLMQQLFLFAQEQSISEHLIIIIDEVSILENPILARFLSELRKYRTSVILSGQFFHQISPNLREAILANTNNYYLFRVSKADAEILESNLQIKLVNDDTKENRCDLLTNLKNRECLVRISNNGTLFPVFKAKTMDFNPIIKKEQENKFRQKENIEQKKFDFNFSTDDVNIQEIMKKNSTSRKKV